MRRLKPIVRTVGDGGVEVRWLTPRNEDVRHIMALHVVHDGQDQWLELSEYNARRILVMMAFFLGVNLPADVTKDIEM